FRLRVSDEENTVFTEIQIRVYPDSGSIPPNPNPGEKKKYDKVLDLTHMDHVDIPCTDGVTIYNRDGKKIAHLRCLNAIQSMAIGESAPLGKAYWVGENEEGDIIAAGTYFAIEEGEDEPKKVLVIK
ncbi:hypothetical protein BVX98_07760, partial [bacterium F11]